MPMVDADPNAEPLILYLQTVTAEHDNFVAGTRWSATPSKARSPKQCVWNAVKLRQAMGSRDGGTNCT